MTSTTHSEQAGPVRFDRKTWGALLVLCGALFLDGLDVSMVGVALPSIDADLDLSTSTLQWIVSGYVLGYGGFLLLGGRAADLLGRRRVFVIALSVFAVASVLGGLVSDGTLLIATRFIKGLAAAFTAPAALSIITTTFPEGPVRNKALSIFTATGASGFSMGLIFGGTLTELGWRWTFFVPGPIALLLVLGAVKLVRDDGRPERLGRGFDLPGAFLSTSAMLLFVLTVVEAPEAGWTSLRTLLSLVVVGALVSAFVAVEQRTSHPLIRLGVLRSPTLRRANFSAMALFGGWVGFQFIGTLYMQELRGWSALEMALAFLPAGLVVAFGAPRSGDLVDRFGLNRVIAVGMSSFVLSYVLFLGTGAEAGYLGAILPTMLLAGVGFMFSFGPLNIAATNGVPEDEQGLASGLVQSSFQLGGAVALAATTAVISSQSVGEGADLHALQTALIVPVVVASIGFLIAIRGLATEGLPAFLRPATYARAGR